MRLFLGEVGETLYFFLKLSPFLLLLFYISSQIESIVSNPPSPPIQIPDESWAETNSLEEQEFAESEKEENSKPSASPFFLMFFHIQSASPKTIVLPLSTKKNLKIYLSPTSSKATNSAKPQPTTSLKTPTSPLPRSKPTPLSHKENPILALRPLLEKGIVVFLQNQKKGQPQKCIVYSLIYQPYHKIKKHLLDYESLKRHIPHMAESKIIRKTKNTVDVYYEIEIPGPNIAFTQRHILHKDGRIEVVSLDGLKGKWMWVPHPIEGGKYTIMAYHSNTDIREQGWLLKRLLQSQPAVQEAINCSGALITVSSLHKAFPKPRPSSHTPFSIKKLLPFLRKGTLSLIKDKTVSNLHPILTYCLVQAPRDKVWKIALNFEHYPTFVPQVRWVQRSYIARNIQEVRFNVGMPLLNYTYTNRYTIGKYTLHVTSIRGASGKYLWKFYPLQNQTIIRYSALASIRNLGFWKMIIQKRPDLENALNLSISLIVLRAIKNYAESLE